MTHLPPCIHNSTDIASRVSKDQPTSPYQHYNDSCHTYFPQNLQGSKMMVRQRNILTAWRAGDNILPLPQFFFSPSIVVSDLLVLSSSATSLQISRRSKMLQAQQMAPTAKAFNMSSCHQGGRIATLLNQAFKKPNVRSTSSVAAQSMYLTPCCFQLK
jgi:hypothetical protein